MSRLKNALRIVENIEAVKLSGKWNVLAKNDLIERYTKNERVGELSFKQIDEHNFYAEISNKATLMEKEHKIRSHTKGLERHAYAPEMNRLHFLNGKTASTPQQKEIESAVKYLAHSLGRDRINKLLNNN
ncbi:MAG: hypothetical protein ABFS35_23560 [Bacteroidota bacterium]